MTKCFSLNYFYGIDYPVCLASLGQPAWLCPLPASEN